MSNRGVSNVIGTILLIGIVIVLVAGLSTFILPQAQSEGDINTSIEISNTTGNLSFVVMSSPPDSITVESDSGVTKTINNPEVGVEYTLDLSSGTHNISFLGKTESGYTEVFRTTQVTIVPPDYSNLDGTETLVVEPNPHTINTNSTHRVYADISGSNSTGSPLTQFQIKYNVGSSKPDLSQFSQEDIIGIGIDRDQDGSIDVSVRDDISSVTVTPEGNIHIDFNGNYTIENGDKLLVKYDDVINPSKTGTFAVEVETNPQSSAFIVNGEVRYEK